MLHALFSPPIHMHYCDGDLSFILINMIREYVIAHNPKVDISLRNAIIPPAPMSGRYSLNPARAERQQRSVSSSGCSEVPPVCKNPPAHSRRRVLAYWWRVACGDKHPSLITRHSSLVTRHSVALNRP